jgi:plastocyanin domain-containing protein
MLTVNLLGISLIILIVWWFWLYKPQGVSASGEQITILVENGSYQPSRIKLPSGQPVIVRFLRKDASPCAASVLIPDAEISQDLPLNKGVLVELPAMEKGEHHFHCQMQMYKGIFLVE